jgi:alpha,alpha-trehalase
MTFTRFIRLTTQSGYPRLKSMLKKTNRLAQRLLGRSTELKMDDVVFARRYIAGYWQKLQRYHPEDDESLLGLPKPYLVPAYEEGHEFDFNELYYWDSYFMVQGLLDTEHKDLVVGILDDLLSLFKRFKVIPNASRTYLMGRSQPPLLTSFIFDVYEAYNMDKEWLKGKIEVAKAEYATVWMGTAKPNWRQVHQGLSRYFDVNLLNDLAEAESGWDMTPRFNRKCLNYLPVDLNAMLYKYEIDFARSAEILNDQTEAEAWRAKAKQRKQTMDKLMWDHLRTWYYDYNFVKQKRSTVSSLAGFYPVWVGMVDDKRAAKMVKTLCNRFEEKGGLATTDMQLGYNKFIPGQLPTQWAYPNGWAPLHFIAIQAMKRYGYDKEAKRIALKWLKTNTDWFTEHGVFLEKYNVVQPHKPPLKGVYPTQVGFGWTNAIFERLCQEYVDK